MPRPWPKLVDGLTLRYPSASEIEDLLAFRNLPDVNRWMLRTHVDPEAFRAEWSAVATSDTDFSCVAILDGSAVGMGFLELADGMHQPGWPKGTEAGIGYIVRPACSGRGVATAIARGLLHAAFVDLGLRRVTAGCFADNSASARVLEKAGMRRERHGVQDSWHHELGWVDGYAYAALATDRTNW
ncbi:GNAT family N-acetyltransferase [Branchiibius sp. NY16-3462-2]|uniref:GNAT family N-acetyltransferase n=1 Tax=Branchiibius sp. NY16-3462-2 TaxID=1807500 RepID=UPI00079BD46C|nr:GNAT family N-acetyltransferase [Branchiibius sp. NY16-3462-2]KYH44090.1 acetyltransferase [Branchiibius sp. NY16-3462-2]